jgi:hypothetical protein
VLAGVCSGKPLYRELSILLDSSTINTMVTIRMPETSHGYLYGSLVVAALSASTGYLLPVSNYRFLRVSEVLCVLWVVLVVAAIVKFGRRGLLTLVGTPLAIWWPVGLRLLVWLCNRGYNACI